MRPILYMVKKMRTNLQIVAQNMALLSPKPSVAFALKDTGNIPIFQYSKNFCLAYSLNLSYNFLPHDGEANYSI